MEHNVREEGNATVIAFEGEIDLQSSPKAREILLATVSEKPNVVVDLSKVTYADSSGVASLVEAYQLSRDRNSHFALAAVSESVLKVLKLARLDTVFIISETVEAGWETGN